jgi:hypothetical protein
MDKIVKYLFLLVKYQAPALLVHPADGFDLEMIVPCSHKLHRLLSDLARQRYRQIIESPY